jgi:hypothetical protein
LPRSRNAKFLETTLNASDLLRDSVHLRWRTNERRSGGFAMNEITILNGFDEFIEEEQIRSA